MRESRLVLLLLIALYLSSCSYNKRKILFKTPEEIETSKEEPIVIHNPQTYTIGHRIAEGDVLMVRLLNEDGATSSYDKLANSREDATFVVHDSLLTLPIIGDIYVEGLNKNQLIAKLTKAYAQHVIDPIVDVDYASLTVNIHGEVEKPGRYPIRDGMDLFEGLALAGGIGLYGIYDNVKIIRGEGEQQEIITIDATNIAVLSNEKLLLRDKDIIYVEPRRVKQFETSVKPYLFFTSIITSAVAIFIVITRTN